MKREIAFYMFSLAVALLATALPARAQELRYPSAILDPIYHDTSPPLSELIATAPLWEPPTLPQRVELLQIYPNPFNPTTRIQYILPQREHVKLQVFDVLGREVALLVDEIQAPGTHSVQWNGSGVASGIYLYQLRTSQSILTRKMILLR